MSCEREVSFFKQNGFSFTFVTHIQNDKFMHKFAIIEPYIE